MNKAEFIAAIVEKTNLTKLQAEAACNAVFGTITEAMLVDKIMIPGFGTFAKKVRAERQGRNPKTGDAIKIPKAVVATFKPAPQLKEIINTQGE